METFRSCNVCGHSPPVFLYRKEGYSIVRCPGCSLAYAGDRLEGIDFHRLHDSSYYRSDDSRLYAETYARDCLGLNVFTGTLEEAKFPEGFFPIW